MSNLTEQDVALLQWRLQHRREELRRAIDVALQEAKTDDAPAAVAAVRDRGDESVAESTAGATLTMLDREANELRDVEAALQRIRVGSYGICEACGRAIGRERLEAFPVATRCVHDQQRYERARAGGQDMTPSL